MSCSRQDCPFPLSCGGFHGNSLTMIDDNALFEEEIEQACRAAADAFYEDNKHEFMIGRGREFYERGALTSFKRACRCLVNGSETNEDPAVIREDMAFLESKFPGFKGVAELFGWHWLGFAPPEALARLQMFLLPFTEWHNHKQYPGDERSLFYSVTMPTHGDGWIHFKIAKRIIETNVLDVYSNVSIAGQFNHAEERELIDIIRSQTSPTCVAGVRARLAHDIPRRSTFHKYKF